MKRSIILLILIQFLSCRNDNSESKYLRWVGDSKYDPAIDTSGFHLCNGEETVKQYFHFDQGLSYEGEMKAIIDRFTKEYRPIKSNQSGWVRIRFIVNCNGQAGRFRLISANLDYEEEKFDPRIINQLMNITKSLDGWSRQSKRGRPQDYYQYLIFKIDKGHIIEIMP